MDTELNDRVVMVTGASGGIGQEVARAFVAEGARVIAHYRRGAEHANALAQELGKSARPSPPI
jgi:3-oxoacyl-[acyl-carrier protein] reductase